MTVLIVLCTTSPQASVIHFHITVQIHTAQRQWGLITSAYRRQLYYQQRKKKRDWKKLNLCCPFPYLLKMDTYIYDFYHSLKSVHLEIVVIKIPSIFNYEQNRTKRVSILNSYKFLLYYDWFLKRSTLVLKSSAFWEVLYNSGYFSMFSFRQDLSNIPRVSGGIAVNI